MKGHSVDAMSSFGEEEKKDATLAPKRLKPNPVPPFNWHPLSFLFRQSNAWLLEQCSRDYHDQVSVVIYRRRDCDPTVKGTVREMAVNLRWQADDLNRPELNPNPLLPLRDHERLLRRYFFDFGLRIEKWWGYWYVHVFFEPGDVPRSVDLRHSVMDNRQYPTLSPPLPLSDDDSNDDARAEDLF
jgi:hypothetical protein